MSKLTILPFDLTGKLASNRIVGEERTLTFARGKTNRMLAPLYGAYYKDSLEVRTSNGAPLTLDKDYVTTYYYPDVWELNAKAVCAIIVVTNPNISNNIRISYNALGGPYSFNVDEIKAILDEVKNIPEKVSFDEILGKPLQYNPPTHPHEYWQLYGLESTIANLDILAKTWAQGSKGILDNNRYYYRNYVTQAQALVDDYANKVTAHINDLGNPHKDNAKTVGLDLINNWPMANLQESPSITVNSRYQPMGGVYDQLLTHVIPVLNSHVKNYSNPHRVRLDDPLLNLYSTDQINALLNDRLSVGAVAADSSAIGGVSGLGVWNTIRSDLSVDNVQPGSIFNQAQLAAAAPSDTTNYAFVGDQGYRSYKDLIGAQGGGSQLIYFIGSAPVTDYNYLPVGSYAIKGQMVLNYNIIYYMELNAYQKTSATGWVQIL